MRIQCKRCGKEYRVDERRLTPQGLRVQCRSCGAVLLVRLQKDLGTVPKKEKEPVSVAEENQTDKMPSGNAQSEESAGADPESGNDPSEESTGAGPGQERDAAVSGYRFCMSCGTKLKGPVSAGEPPICGLCAVDKGRSFLRSGQAAFEESASLPRRKKNLLFAIILLLLLLSAFVGYQMAMGDVSSVALTMNSSHEHLSLPQKNNGSPGP